MSEVRSERGSRTSIDDLSALGDEVVVQPGVRLSGGEAVYPRLKVPAGIQVPPGTELTGPEDVLQFL